MPLKGREDFIAGKTWIRFTHHKETAHPRYYQVLLTETDINVERSATPHAGIFRFTFRSGTVPAIYVGGVKALPDWKTRIQI